MAGSPGGGGAGAASAGTDTEHHRGTHASVVIWCTGVVVSYQQVPYEDF